MHIWSTRMRANNSGAKKKKKFTTIWSVWNIFSHAESQFVFINASSLFGTVSNLRISSVRTFGSVWSTPSLPIPSHICSDSARCRTPPSADHVWRAGEISWPNLDFLILVPTISNCQFWLIYLSIYLRLTSRCRIRPGFLKLKYFIFWSLQNNDEETSEGAKTFAHPPLHFPCE